MRPTTAAMALLAGCAVVFTFALAMAAVEGPKLGYILGMVGSGFAMGTCVGVLMRGDR